MRRQRLFTRLMLAALLGAAGAGAGRLRPQGRAGAAAGRRPTSSRASIPNRPTRRRACSAARARPFHDSFPLCRRRAARRAGSGAAHRGRGRHAVLLLFQRHAGRQLPGLCEDARRARRRHLLFAEGQFQPGGHPHPRQARRRRRRGVGGRDASRAEGRRARRQDRVRRRRQDRAGDGSGARGRHLPVQRRDPSASWRR